MYASVQKDPNTALKMKQRNPNLAKRRAWRATAHKLPKIAKMPDSLAETQGFEPWIQVLARMLP